MPRTTRILEIDSLTDFLAHGQSLAGRAVQALDLSGMDVAWDQIEVTGTIFLGCRFAGPEVELTLLRRGAFIFPHVGERPYNPYRATLYTPAELLAGYRDSGPEMTLDSAIYDHYVSIGRQDSGIIEAMSRRLHDLAIDDALMELVGDDETARINKRIVGFMGGHGARRDDRAYAEVTRLAWAVAREGYFVVSGGGPGIMEAANLGAWLSTYPDPAVLDDAIVTLSRAPDFRADPGPYLDAAVTVRERYPDGAANLAIPTWFYGHEPTNVFATAIAKYFSNSLREDGLLALCIHGVIFGPGSAGTVQEIFMDATQNHYQTFGYVSPMLFLGTGTYQDRFPVAEILGRLSGGKPYLDHLLVSDDPAELLAFLKSHPPVRVENWPA